MKQHPLRNPENDAYGEKYTVITSVWHRGGAVIFERISYIQLCHAETGPHYLIQRSSRTYDPIHDPRLVDTKVLPIAEKDIQEQESPFWEVLSPTEGIRRRCMRVFQGERTAANKVK